MDSWKKTLTLALLFGGVFTTSSMVLFTPGSIQSCPAISPEQPWVNCVAPIPPIDAILAFVGVGVAGGACVVFLLFRQSDRKTSQSNKLS